MSRCSISLELLFVVEFLVFAARGFEQLTIVGNNVELMVHISNVFSVD